MTYRYEGDELIIDGWERGISDGPYSIFSPSALGPVNQTGMVDLSYVNITGIPGEVSIAFPLVFTNTSNSPPNVLANPIQIATQLNSGSAGKVTAYFLLDATGQIFKSISSLGTLVWQYQGTAGAGAVTVVGNSGIVFWQGYLLTFLGNTVYYSSNGGVTNTAWAAVGSIDSSNTHYAISSKIADSVYFCNGNTVGSILLVPGQTFDPTNAATYTFQATAVKIPAYDSANCLAELNGQILIGGSLNRVYPWDANNLSGTGVTSLVGLPLFVGENFIQRIVVTNSNAYVFVGGVNLNISNSTQIAGKGNIYVTNGSTIDVFKKMPDMLTTIAGTSAQMQSPYWQFGDAMFHQNKLWFGAIALANSNHGLISDTGGIWCIDLNSQALFRANEAGSNNSFYITVISPNTQVILGGYDYICGGTAALTVGTGTGVMYVSYDPTTTPGTLNPGRIISDLIPVGSNQIPKTYSQIELKCAVALATGESIDAFVITDVNPSGLLVGSMTSNDGMSRVFTPLNFQSIQWLQVKCVLNPTFPNTATPTYVRLREIRLR